MFGFLGTKVYLPVVKVKSDNKTHNCAIVLVVHIFLETVLRIPEADPGVDTRIRYLARVSKQSSFSTGTCASVNHNDSFSIIRETCKANHHDSLE